MGAKMKMETAGRERRPQEAGTGISLPGQGIEVECPTDRSEPCWKSWKTDEH